MILDYLGAQSGHIAHLKARNFLCLETEDMEKKEKSERLAAQRDWAGCCWFEDGEGSMEVAEGGSWPTASEEKGPSAPEP